MSFKKHVKEFYSFTANTHHIFQIILLSVGVDACAIVHVWGLKDNFSLPSLSLFRFQDRTQAARLPWRYFTH